VATPGTAWPSTTLAHVALGLRKLTRQGLDVAMRMNGQLVLVLAPAPLSPPRKA
jgi:hypothetical protein